MTEVLMVAIRLVWVRGGSCCSALSLDQLSVLGIVPVRQCIVRLCSAHGSMFDQVLPDVAATAGQIVRAADLSSCCNSHNLAGLSVRVVGNVCIVAPAAEG